LGVLRRGAAHQIFFFAAFKAELFRLYRVGIESLIENLLGVQHD
jgi:hypothetical protein